MITRSQSKSKRRVNDALSEGTLKGLNVGIWWDRPLGGQTSGGTCFWGVGLWGVMGGYQSECKFNVPHGSLHT